MANDPISTLGPSDSGFLNSFLTPQPSQPLQSRVGEEPAVDLRRNAPPPDAAVDEELVDEESVLETDAPPAGLRADQQDDDETVIDDSAGDVLPDSALLTDEQIGDAQLDARLLATPMPEGFLTRMRRLADES